MLLLFVGSMMWGYLLPLVLNRNPTMSMASNVLRRFKRDIVVADAIKVFLIASWDEFFKFLFMKFHSIE